MAFVIDVDAAKTAELVEDAGEPGDFEMEWDMVVGVRETCSAVEPIEEHRAWVALAYVDYSVTLEVGGKPVVRASYEACEEVERLLYSREDPEPSFDDDELIADAPEWIDDPFLWALMNEELPQIVEEAGGSMTAEELAARFSDKWHKVEVLA